MQDRIQRPSVDRPRYTSIPTNINNTKKKNKVVNRKTNIQKKQDLKQQQKVINNQMNKMQQPISGSVNKIDENAKVKSPIKPKPNQNMKTKKQVVPPQKPKVDNKGDNGLFKQMKDKFIGKPKDANNN